MAERQDATDDPQHDSGAGADDASAAGGADGVPVTQQIGRVVIGVLALLFLAFAFVNRQDVDVDWVFTTAATPLIVLLLGAFLLGALSGGMLFWRRQKVRRRQGPDA